MTSPAIDPPYSIQSVLLVYNTQKPHTDKAVEKVKRILSARRISIHAIKNWIRGEAKEDFEEQIRSGIEQHDLVIVFGGDGTMLGVARLAAGYATPVFGINMGRFGFLTASQYRTMDSDLECILNGNYRLIHRYLLEAWVIRNGREIFRSLALNEALVTLSRPGRLINVQMLEENVPTLAYRCDGVIVSTPTGSSGHSLSAGGPILEPHLAALIITPVSPHSLFNRPLVVDGQHELGIEFSHDDNGKELILDGQIHFTLQSSDRVNVIRSSQTVPTIALPHLNFTKVLQHKFNIGNVP